MRRLKGMRMRIATEDRTFGRESEDSCGTGLGLAP